MSNLSVLRTRLAALFVVALGLSLVPATASADHITTHPTDSACANAPEDGFVDTGADGSAQEEAVDCIAWYQITGGTTQTTYSPTLPISRMQMATMVAQAMRQSTEDFAEPGPNEDFFEDDEGSNHEGNINFVAKHGVVKGLDEDNYGPTQSVTRAQMASFLVNLLRAVGAELPQTNENFFDDDDGSVHEGNINVLAELGIATGRTHRGYEPQGNVTRGQMALFISRTLDEMVDQNLLVTPGQGQAGAVTVTLNQTSVPQGGQLTGSITSSEEPVESARVSGCGLSNQALEDRDTDAEGIQFRTFIPATQPPGQCQLTFNVTLEDDSTATAQLTITVTGQPTVTDAPELISVSVDDEDRNSVDLRFTFDEDIAASIVEANFRLYSFGAQQTEATDASREGSNFVIATFPADAFENATVATVANAAVQDADGLFNPEGSIPLTGLDLDAGETAAPDLVEVDNIDEGGTNTVQADYTFDEDVSTATASGFHLILDNGVVYDGDRIVDHDDEVVRVELTYTPSGSNPPSGDIDDSPARRGYVDADSVEDGDGNSNASQSADASNDGVTRTPDLVSITLDQENDEIIYRFDESVDLVESGGPIPPAAPDPAKFQLYRQDGSEVEADDVREGDTNTTIVAEFEAGDVDESVVGASVDEGAVESNADGEDNRFDEEGVEQDVLAGRTLAPDLVSVTMSTEDGPPNGQTTNLVFRFTFDQAVLNENMDTDPSDGFDGFIVYTEDGRRRELPDQGVESGCERDSDEPNVVICTVNSQEGDQGNTAAYTVASDAVLGAVENGAVTDTSGDHENYESADPFPVEDDD